MDASCKKLGGAQRDSNLELFRIVTMLMIVAHHYVVNSGVLELINSEVGLQANDVLLLLISWGGKPGINCFVLLSGYFMCTSTVTMKKIVKLLGVWYFYNVSIYMLFLMTGYEMFSVKELAKVIFPITSLGRQFMPSFFVFYLFIPFLNRLIKAMDRAEHMKLLILSLVVYTVLPSFCMIAVPMNYIVWFMVIYLISSYIRLYPLKLFSNTKFWLCMMFISMTLSAVSVLGFSYIGKPYFWVSDSNKILAVMTSVSMFLFFKNIKISYNAVINAVGLSTFGVFLIHTSSDTMRRWLWNDVFHVVEYYDSSLMIAHAIITVITVFSACMLIDMARSFLLNNFRKAKGT